jgi:hypothetical protein
MRDGLQSIADIMPTETKSPGSPAEYAAGVREMRSLFRPAEALPSSPMPRRS